MENNWWVEFFGLIAVFGLGFGFSFAGFLAFSIEVERNPILEKIIAFVCAICIFAFIVGIVGSIILVLC